MALAWKAGWVNALRGSYPLSSANPARHRSQRRSPTAVAPTGGRAASGQTRPLATSGQPTPCERSPTLDDRHHRAIGYSPDPTDDGGPMAGLGQFGLVDISGPHEKPFTPEGP